MIQKPKSTFLYQQDILVALTQTGIRQTSPGGKARAFCDIVGDQLGQLEVRQFANLAQTLIPYATGDSLDFLGELYGLRRIPRTDVTIAAADGNFQFYVQQGNFGSINNGQDIVIPAGTRIFTSSAAGPIYLTDGVTLPASASSQSFSATALSAGSGGVAASGVFTRHNFTNYSDARFGSLLVTNNYGLIGGRDQETDDSYRYRINLKLHARGGAAEADLRLAVLAIPGVQDLVLDRKAGTFLLYVYGISPSVPVSLLQTVQQAIDERTAFPMVGTAVVPDLVGISLNTTVKVASTVSAADRAGVLSAAQTAAENYINNLKVGDPLILNELADQILSADTRIQDIGDPNQPLQNIFIWRSRLDGTRYSRYLISNYTPVLGERIVVESIASAVNLVLA